MKPKNIFNELAKVQAHLEEIGVVEPVQIFIIGRLASDFLMAYRFEKAVGLLDPMALELLDTAEKFTQAFQGADGKTLAEAAVTIMESLRKELKLYDQAFSEVIDERLDRLTCGSRDDYEYGIGSQAYGAEHGG